MKTNLILSLCFLMLLISCAQIDLDTPKGEEFPLNGPKRAVLGEVSFPAQNEGLVSVDVIRAKLGEWADTIRLSRSQLDEVRLFKGGEMNHLLDNIRQNSSLSVQMADLRKLGVIFQIHPQQILNQALPVDPDLSYSEDFFPLYTSYLLQKAKAILQNRNSGVYSSLNTYEAELYSGIEAELKAVQSFPYNYTRPRLSQSWNPDKNWSMGYENISTSNPFDGLHKNPPSLLLKALGLLYGMKTLRYEQNFFDESITVVVSEEPGILNYLEKNKLEQAWNLIGRLMALTMLSSLPEQFDSKYPEEESIYRDKWLPFQINGVEEIISKPEGMVLEKNFWGENWQETQYGFQILNYLNNDMVFAGNLKTTLLRIGQRADFYPSPGKMGNGLYEWDGDLAPYYPDSLAYQDWNYYPYRNLYFYEGNTGSEDKVVIKSGEQIISIPSAIIEMTLHLEPLAVAGMVRILDFLDQNNR